MKYKNEKVEPADDIILAYIQAQFIRELFNDIKLINLIQVCFAQGTKQLIFMRICLSVLNA